jgi:hypothetical protein
VVLALLDCRVTGVAPGLLGVAGVAERVLAAAALLYVAVIGLWRVSPEWHRSLYGARILHLLPFRAAGDPSRYDAEAAWTRVRPCCRGGRSRTCW